MTDNEKLQEENQKLLAEVVSLKGLLRQFREHAIDVDGDHWACAMCGKRESLEKSTEDFVHEDFCPLK